MTRHPLDTRPASRSKKLAGSLLCLALVAAAACGGKASGGGPGPGSGDTSTLSEFASAFCSLFNPCCADAGLPATGAQCQTLVIGLGGSTGTYNASAGSACIAAAQAEPNLCGSISTAIPACTQVFATGGGSVKAGGACTQDGDCAIPSGGGSASCYITATLGDGGTTTETGTCFATVPGQAGSTPCLETITELPGGGTATSSSPSTNGGAPVWQGYSCDEGSGVYCDSTTSACAALVPAGGSCAGTEQCVLSAYCSDAKCVAKAPVGSSCADATCDATSYCDTSNVCAALLPSGAACQFSMACASG